MKVQFTAGGGTGNSGALLLDGVPLPNVRGVVLRSAVGQVNRVEVELLALRGLDVSLAAEVAVSIQAMPGYDLVASTLPDGRTRYTVVATEVSA